MRRHSLQTNGRIRQTLCGNAKRLIDRIPVHAGWGKGTLRSQSHQGWGYLLGAGANHIRGGGILSALRSPEPSGTDYKKKTRFTVYCQSIPRTSL
eukprot:3521079-Pyramimonas_sp.AAC.1